MVLDFRKEGKARDTDLGNQQREEKGDSAKEAQEKPKGRTKLQEEGHRQLCEVLQRSQMRPCGQSEWTRVGNGKEKGQNTSCIGMCQRALELADSGGFRGVPTVPLLPPQVNQSLTSVPPMNPATTLPGLMPLPAGLPNLPALPNLNLPTPHVVPGVSLPELVNPGLPPLPSLPPRNLAGIAMPSEFPMPSEFLPSFPLVPEVSSSAGSAELLSSLPPTGSPPSDPVPATAKADAASALTVDVTPPTPKAPATVEDRVGEPTPASEKPVSAVTDANASESP
ncbi:Golgi reassembly-stacking protein 2 [Camelus dromedarius]|uniref:Golgi reassembly-stacking protein 2 n=1 Tax=Camelus dromedarius TaxID=9838 RepID=A0A5N4E6Z4_CAMDR|nr:Golgi reassembly-stacking protein 2 [Camelus dromedarius]